MFDIISSSEEVLTLLKVKEVAEKLNVHKETVRRWIKKGELPAFDSGRGYRISRDDLNKFVENRTTA